MGSFDGLFERAKQNYPESFAGQTGGSQTVPIAHGTVQQTVDFTGLAERAKKNYPEAFSSTKTSGNYLQNQWLKKYQGKGYNSLASSLLELEDGDEKDWLKSYAQKVDYDEKLALDLSAYEKEIQALERQLEDYNPDIDWTNPTDRKKFDADIEAMQVDIDKRKNYLTLAKRVQEQAASEKKYSQVTKNADFAEKSGFDSNNQEIGYQYVNADAAGRLDLEQKYGQYVKQFADHAYDSLDAEEKAIYNYLMNTGDRQGAAEYLKYIEQTAQERKGTAADAYIDKLVEEDPRAKIARYAYMANVGLDQHKTSMQDLGHMLSGNEEYVSPSATQYAGAKVREDLASDGKKLPDWMGGGSTGQMVGDIISTTANMAPSILASTVVGLLNPSAGAAVGKGMMSGGAAGSGYRELINEGYTKEQARLYGLGLGAAEYFMESALGGISKLGGAPAKALAKWAENVDNSILKLALRLGGSGGSEGLEEGLQEVISGWLKSKITHEDFYAEPADVMYSSLLGMATGVLFEAPEAITDSFSGKNDTASGATADKLAAVGDKMSATETVSKMENIQQTDDLDSFAQQFGDQADAVRDNYAEGQDLQEYEAGFQVAYALGMEGGNVDTLKKSVPYLNQSQREAAYNLGRAAADNVNAGVDNANAVTTNEDPASAAEVAAIDADEVTAAETGNVGSAVQISTGKNVEVSRISSISKDGSMTLELSDGTTVDAGDIQHRSEGEAVLYEAVAAIGADAEVSNILVNNWKNDPGGVSAEQYTAGMIDAFNYGRYHVPQKEMSDNKSIQALTPVQRNSAYALGKSFGGQLVQTQEANARRAKAIAKAQSVIKASAQKKQDSTPKKKTTAKTTPASRVNFDRKGKKLNPVQESSLQVMEMLAQATGTKFHVYESYVKNGKRVYKDASGKENAAPNGWYETGSGEIHIDLNAGLTADGTMLYTTAHELTHFIREWSPAKFDTLAEVLFEQVYKEKDISVIGLIRGQQEKAVRTGREISFDEAYEEVVADSMESILTSGNVVDFMAQVKQKDQTLWEKIREWFKNLVEDIRKLVQAYSGHKPDSPEGRAVASMKDMLPILEGFYADALDTASENFQAAEVEKNTTHNGGVKYSIPYRDAIDLLADGDLDRKTNTHLLVSDHTPQVYIDKAGAKDQKIIMGWDIAYLAMNKSGDIPGNYHGLGRDVMKKLPEALKDPLYIVKQNNGRVAAVTEIVVKKNRSVVVSVEFDAFKSTVQDGENESDNYNIIVTAMDAKPNYLQNTILSGNIVYNKNNENPANFILRLKSLNKALPNDDLARSSKTSIRNAEPEVNRKFSHRDPLQEKAAQALEMENQRLREDVKGLKDLVKLQGKLTGGKIMNPSSIEKAARVLKKNADAKGDTKELAQLLTDFYSYISGSPDLTWEGVKEAAQKAADWLWENRREEVDEYSAEILQDLRTRSISLSDSQKAEAAVTHDTFGNYRKSLFGSVKITKDGMSLDETWHELASLYPGVFDENMNANDMPASLADIVSRLKSSKNMAVAYDQDMLRQALIRDVYDSYWNVSTLHTVADVKQKEINALKGRHAQQMSDLRAKHRDKVAELRKERSDAVAAVRASERQKAKSRTEKALKKYQDNQELVAANRAERKGKTALRRQIRKTVFELEKLLNRGNKKKNVKDGMNAMVSSSLKLADALFMDEYSNRDMLRNGVGVELTDAEEKTFKEAQDLLQQTENTSFLETMTFDSEEAAQDHLKKLEQKLGSKMSALKDVFARERKRLYGTKVSELIGKLAEEYNSLSDAEDGAVRAAKDENVYAHLLQLQKDVKDVTVRDMSLAQLEMVADAYTMVLTTVRNANKMFAKNLKFKRDTLSNMVMGEIGSAVKKISKLVKPGKDLKDSFSWNNLKPVYAFERLGSDTLKALYGNIRKGQDIWAVDMQEADTFRREQYRKHGWKKWDPEKLHSFDFESGKIELNLGQIMSLYAYSRREAALDHLLKGGFVFGGSTEVFVKENGIKRRYLKKDATAYNLTADELLQVIGTLTKEQKNFVEEMQTYLSDVMGGKGNEVSLQMYGIKSFGEKNYFPLHSARQYMEKAKEDSFKKEQGQISIVNSGFTKATTPHASNPITLDAFMDVWAEHVNDMSMYHGFVLPMEDFRRVYNYSSPNVEVGNSKSVNAAIENAFGEAATGYIDQLYKDLNGGAVSDNRETIGKKLVGLHKKAAVFASWSVVIQQPSAFVRAFALVDPGHFVGPKVDKQRHKQLWAELKQYAPVAFVKEMGYFDTGMGKSAKDYLQAEEYSGIREKMVALFADGDYRDEVLGKAPALADEYTWCTIWEAVKRETKAKNPGMNVKGTEFLQIAGDRFAEVIDKTQVYDSVLSRSANMRSKSLHMNMLTSFLAEPTTSINMLEDALRKGDRKHMKRTVGAVYGSVLLNSLLVSLVYAARDDDEDETFWEKYLSSVAVEMLDGLNPITYYPFLKDIWSIGQGFDVERSDMSLITDFADAAKKVVGGIQAVTSAEEGEEESAMAQLKDSLWRMVDTIANLTGLPVKNIRRDIEAARNVVDTISTDRAGRMTTKLSLKDAVLAEVMNAIPVAGLLYEKSKRDRLYSAIVAKDKAYVDRLKAGYETDESYHSAIKLALRDHDSRIWEAAVAWNNNDLKGYMALAREIIAEGNFIQDDVVLAIRAEASSMEESQSASSSTVKGYFTNEKFAVALSQNNTAMADIIRKDLIDTKVANGKTRSEAEKAVESTARSQLKELFETGSISASVAEKMLVKYGGYEQDDAAEKISAWKYETDHPELDGRITFSQYQRWEADGKSRGISLEVYTNVIEYRGGDTSSGTRSQEDVAAYINSMPISTAQKDALWCCFWSESTLYKKAPWH